MSEPIPEAYAWLADALRPRCDEVICGVFDHGRRTAIGARWDNSPRQSAIIVEDEYRGFSLNATIEAGRLSKEQVLTKIMELEPVSMPS
jgi:hypothetical protein